MRKTRWKILDVFPAKADEDDRDITVVSVYPINDTYCGDSYHLLLEPEELEFWKSHIGETFELEGDPDLMKMSSKELREVLKEKVEFT